MGHLCLRGDRLAITFGGENRLGIALKGHDVLFRVSHTAEIAVNAVNVGLSLVFVLLLVALARTVGRLGLDLVVARLYLQKRQAARAVLLIIAGLSVFILSNVLELYGDVFHLDWYVNEIVETLSLTPMIAGLVQYRAILRVAAKAQRAASLEAAEVVGK